MEGINALFFDIFGTCVDWRSGVIREAEAAGRQFGLTNVDWPAFADAWRARYQPQMETVRSGTRPWTLLDRLHRESLDLVIAEFGLDAIGNEARDELNLVWHRLDPWPDTVPGLQRLKRGFVISPVSNGGIALLTNMAKRAGLPWDVILGAEFSRAYKPLPKAYLRCVGALQLRPDQVMMVAAHNNDLVAAKACGLRTAFVPRPTEHGSGQTVDLQPELEVDLDASDFVDLAERLGV